MKNRRALNDVEKMRVLLRDRYTCRYCGTKKGPFHIDHVYPHSKGGETSVRNSVTACKRCNLSKHDRVGIWPKPIGYFDNRKVPYLPHVILLTVGLALVGNGFWDIHAPLGNSVFVGDLSMLSGIVALSLALVRMALGW